MRNTTLTFGLVLTILIGCAPKTQEQVVEQSGDSQYRPAYHFTPASGWMNDPNGLVYFEGEYHLFYQHYPDSNIWGPMHWGHAVSTDLVHWEHLPIALYPDSLGYIFSGSAVVDWQNTAGFGTEESPAMVAMYTYHDPIGERNNTIDFQTQGIAYSLDKGRTWTKYEGNPVIPNPGIRDFRDPKVSWNSETEEWNLILAVKDHVNLYSSPNLKEWTHQSEFGVDLGAHGGVWECPDLFQLTDQNGVTKWVMLVSINPGGPQGGSATQYFVGDFDGSVFTPLGSAIRWIDYGADNYAGVTFSDVPEEDGRRLFIGWMSNWQYANIVPTYEWRSAMTIPRELKIQNTENGYLLRSVPVGEMESAFTIEGANGELINVSGSVFKLGMTIESSTGAMVLSNDVGDSLIVSYDENYLTINREQAGKVAFSDVFAASHQAPLNGIEVKSLDVYVDNSSVEVFVNNGDLVMTDLFFFEQPVSKVKTSGSTLVTYLPNED
ncbi:glycoside hydrolase family 32 protein [Marinoscillum pacificum]|uniref:glycoside hydrolase family 32 protein n=1 Tax=Marinoscillum pacificum TaxID=392723 RepID=UPI002158165C|nr:glycoside hydrolase family 32 protein [Marinoscillum pacificum]